MKLLKYTVLLIFSLSIWTSCENFFNATVELPTPDHTPILAISSFATNTDSVVFVVDVNRTYGLFEERPNNSQDGLNDATVEILENGNSRFEFQTEESSPGLYFAEIPEGFGGIGNTYELKVTHPTFGTASASQVMPEPIPLANIEVRRFNQNQGNFNDASGELKLTFNDPPNERNYYELIAQKQCIFSYEDGQGNIVRDTFPSEVYFETSEDTPGADLNTTQGYDWGAIMLDDTNFNGQEFTFSPRFYDSCFVEGEDPTNQIYKVFWRTVSEEYFNYSKSLYLNSISQDNPFAEPVSVFTNVEGGIGAFCLKSELRYDVR